ncbi:MAG TPA: S26 family signal peptidase [Acidimicrobiia bacterium]
MRRLPVACDSLYRFRVSDHTPERPMSMKRFRVAGHSMLPTLQPGQEVVAVNTRTPRPGNLVVFQHPNDTSLWLIKRLVDDEGTVLSDNREDSAHDSHDFGPIHLSRLWNVVDRLDADTFVLACEMLISEDPDLAELVDRWGIPEFWNRRPGFETLVLLILEQQVSLASGAAMYGRVARLTGRVTPGNVLAAGEHRLRSIGLTRQKTGYLLDLARRLVDGELDLAILEELSEDVARRELISIRGIGPWTADAYLLSASRRPDMWPVGDRALQVGSAEVLGLDSVPDEAELEILAESWRPVRAVAARLIWHSYLSERGRVEPPDATLVHAPETRA